MLSSGVELACSATAFDQPTPALVPTVLTGDLAPAGQRTAISPVHQRPQPRLPLQLPARPGTVGRPVVAPGRPGRSCCRRRDASLTLASRVEVCGAGFACCGSPVFAAPRR